MLNVMVLSCALVDVVLICTALNMACNSVGLMLPLNVNTPVELLYELVTPVGRTPEYKSTSPETKPELITTKAPSIVPVSLITI